MCCRGCLFFPRERMCLHPDIMSKQHFPRKLLSMEKYFIKVLTFTCHVSVIDFWHFSNVGIIIMIINVLLENLKSISNISWTFLMCWKWFQTQRGDIKERCYNPVYIWYIPRYIKKHICVSISLCKENSETDNLTWQNLRIFISKVKCSGMDTFLWVICRAEEWIGRMMNEKRHLN